MTMEDSDITLTFHTVDYIIFGSLLVFSMTVGLYHSVRGNKTSTDFLLAGRSMSPLPVALSLSATSISAIAFLGVVGEVYGHGIQQMWFLAGYGISMVVVAQAIIPLLYSLNLNCINQYIELRFESVSLKRIISSILIISQSVYLGFCLYAPTLALDAVTPLSYHVTIPLLGLIVTLYSALGGLKAVIWTDVFQSMVMIGGLLMFTVYSIVQLGGPSNMWQIASQHNRTGSLDFRFGSYVRHTVVNTIIMGISRNIYSTGFDQSVVQRINTMPTLTNAQQLSYMGNSLMILLMMMLYLCGLGLFGLFASCDPLSTGLIKKKDQILPLFVVQYMGKFTGVPGLFVACLFSGALSSLSSVLSESTTMIWLDFLSEFSYFQKLSENSKLTINRITTLLLGLITIIMAFLATSISGILEATFTVQSAMSGPIFGMYILAILVPACSKRGAIAGVSVSSVIMIWLTTGAKYYGVKSKIMPLPTHDCNVTSYGVTGNASLSTAANSTSLIEFTDAPHPFYGISYTYFHVLGAAICFVVGCIVTIFPVNRSELVDPNLVLPCVRRFTRKIKSEAGEQMEAPEKITANASL